MAGPKRVEVSVTGILNGRLFTAQGSLKVDDTQGTKSGNITYQPPPQGVAPGPDSTTMQTGKCFIGARHVGERRFVGPVELLGREFISMRLTTVGRFGSTSVSERARIVGDVLRTELTTVGELRVPGVRGLGPLREVISVTAPDSLTSEGRYSFLTARRGRVPVRYVHLYRSLSPDRRLFRRQHGNAFLLRADISTKFRGRILSYHSRSTIRRLKTP